MILDDLKSKVIEFQKSKDTERLGILRYFLSEVKYKEIELRPQNIEVTDEIVFKVLKKQIKNLNQSIELFAKGNRQDLVDKNKREFEIYKEFAGLFPYELEQ